MGSRTVRLDEDAEHALREIRKVTGMSISEALKKGLLVLRAQVRAEQRRAAWEVYERIDLGPGGYAAAPARDSKRAVTEAVRRKHPR